MKKLLLIAFTTSIFVTHGVARAEKKESGQTWIHIWNDTPQELQVLFHVGENITESFYNNIKIIEKGKESTVVGDSLHTLNPGQGATLSARWGEGKIGTVTSKTLVSGIPKGILFITKKNGKKYYLSHKDANGNKTLMSLQRFVRIREDGKGGLTENWYFGLGSGPVNTIPKLKKGDLTNY